MKTNPKVSVHIISYNQKDYIAEALESALSQEYDNLEVVVSDDASTDGTADIVERYATRYPEKVKALLNTANVGVTRNANRALRICTGKYIAFQGGDDVLLPGKITAQVNWLEQDDNRVLCGHQVEVFYQDGSRPPHPQMRKMRSGIGADVIIRNGAYGATSIMVRASKIPPYGFDESVPVASDQLLWVEVLADGGEFGFVPGTLARYRRHSTNVTREPLSHMRDIEKYLQIVEQKYPQYRNSCEFARTRHLIYMTGVNSMNAGKTKEARRAFSEAIRRDPLFVKAWIRILQVYSPFLS